MRLACRIATGPKRAPLRLVVPMSNGMPAIWNAASPGDRDRPRKVDGVAKVGVARHHVRSAKRNTAAATAHVQRPAGSPTAAAVMEVLPKMRLLV